MVSLRPAESVTKSAAYETSAPAGRRETMNQPLCAPASSDVIADAAREVQFTDVFAANAANDLQATDAPLIGRRPCALQWGPAFGCALVACITLYLGAVTVVYGTLYDRACHLGDREAIATRALYIRAGATEMALASVLTALSAASLAQAMRRRSFARRTSAT
jgi:hypothetical protein